MTSAQELYEVLEQGVEIINRLQISKDAPELVETIAIHAAKLQNLMKPATPQKKADLQQAITAAVETQDHVTNVLLPLAHQREVVQPPQTKRRR